MATYDDLVEVSRLLSEAALLLRWCGEDEARVLDGEEAEAAVLPEDLRGLYRDAVGQLLEQVQGGLDRWGPVLDSAGWSGPLLRFKLAVLRRAGRESVMGWARGLSRVIPRRALKVFLAALNAALGSLGAIPGVDLLKELKEFLERAIDGDGGAGAGQGDSGQGNGGGGGTGRGDGADDDHDGPPAGRERYEPPPGNLPRGTPGGSVVWPYS